MRLSICVAATLLLATAFAHAQDASPPAAEEEIQSIQVTGVKDPLSIPYPLVYTMLTEMKQTSAGRVRMTFRVTSSKTHQPVPNLEIYLRGEHTDEKVAVSPTGVIDIPLNQVAYEEKAELVANVKKGGLAIDGFLAPELDAGNPRYADMVEIIALAKRVRAQLLPWYMRLATPTVAGIGICYPARGQAVAVEGSSAAPRLANVDKTNQLKENVFCAAYKEREPDLPANAVLLAPPGWQALFISSFF